MTAQQMIELVLAQSPVDDGSIAELYLDKAMAEFCEQTGMVRRLADITLSQQALEHEVAEPDDIIQIRSVENHEGVELVNTNAPSYLVRDNGFWYVKATNGAVPTLAIGYWNGSEPAPFPADTTLRMLYEAQTPLVPPDESGEPDYGASPDIPSRWHDAVVVRASEKANFANPELRRYYFAVWRDELRKAKAFANTMNTRARWNMKVYTL